MEQIEKARRIGRLCEELQLKLETKKVIDDVVTSHRYTITFKHGSLFCYETSLSRAYDQVLGAVKWRRHHRSKF